jgi:superfamily I DNA/RNA helicase/RecB family exonuclease
MSRSYVLRRRPGAAAVPPVLDPAQRAVVDHPGGPLLVLAGPGTGKTTTLVELVADRVERHGLRPDQVLVLTFSRKAAEELRARIVTRLGRSAATPMVKTFHSFCYGLLSRFDDPESYARPLQLLSAPEQDVRVREVLQSAVETGRLAWPDALRAAVGARGIAPELARMLAQVRSLGLDPEQLAEAGERHGRADWVATGAFLEEYLQVMDEQRLVDYAEVVHRARLVAATPEHQRALREQFRLVVVDEYQDTDPAQVGLLRGLAGDGHDLVVVGDPDQSIYAFRGADVGGILGFPRAFPTRDGAPAPVLALSSTRRFGARILAASRAVAERLPLPPGLDPRTRQAFRHPEPLDPPFGEGRVEVAAFTSPAAEAEGIADALRRAHLDEEVPWSQMAVLVRSGARSIPRLRRALSAAGVPVQVAGDEIPLNAEPAVKVLLSALRAVLVVADLRRSGAFGEADLADSPKARSVDAEALLTSPLCRLDAREVRHLAQRLRSGDRRPSSTVLLEAVLDPAVAAAVPGAEAQAAGRLAGTLHEAADLVLAGEPAEQVLWHLWSRSPWPTRLAADARGSGTGMSAADRDLDAVCALFDLAARSEERQQRRQVSAFLEEVDGQQIPGQSLAEQGIRGEAVRLLTAHRSKGLEWRLVVVAGVQEGVWPDLRHRGSLLQAERLAAGGDRTPAGPSTAAVLAEERRLFYVALTRARERLLVTAVASASDDGDQPSRFLADLVELPRADRDGRAPATVHEVLRARAQGRPRRPLSLRGLLGDLRARLEATEDPVVRAALARRVAAIAAVETPSGPLVPAARPRTWWGMLEPTGAAVPVRPADEPLALSGSTIDSVTRCPLRWFLDREAGGSTAQTAATGFGSIVHALAAAVVSGEVEPEVEAMRGHLDRVWSQLDFTVPWADAKERQEAEDALGRFVAWHLADRGRRPVAAEHAFSVTFEVDGEPVHLRGSMDRVEVDADGRVVVVDLKTGKRPPRAEEIAEHAQLGAYQLAVRHGAVDDVVPGGAALGGAELVQLRTSVRGVTKVQHQPPLADDSFAERQLLSVVRTIRDEEFAGAPGSHCKHCEFATLCPAQAEGAHLLAADRADRSAGETSEL